MTSLDAGLWRQLERVARGSRRAARGLLPICDRHDAPADHCRDYSPGDDYRSIDWRACARHDELVVRVRGEYGEGCVVVLLDCSRSMATGRPPKFLHARKIAAVLGAAALGHGDGFAAVAFAEKTVAELPPIRGQGQLLRMARFLERLSPCGSSTDLARAARELARRRWRAGRVVVVSDFLEPNTCQRGLDVLRCHGYVASVVHVVAREDAEPELLGDAALCDAETGPLMHVVLREQHLVRYRRLFDEYVASVRSVCRRRGLEYVQVRGGARAAGQVCLLCR